MKLSKKLEEENILKFLKEFKYHKIKKLLLKS
jgi:hypothetical protein